VNHSQWKTRRSRKLLDETVEKSRAYVEAGYALALGQAVYNRRTSLGPSQCLLVKGQGPFHDRCFGFRNRSQRGW